jgi:hypothetical protein
MSIAGFEWLGVLRAYAGHGAGVYRYPEDVVRRDPNALAHAYSLDRDGYLHRNPATGYFAITAAGLDMVASLEKIP